MLELKILVTKAKDSKFYVGEVPAMPGCMSQGETEEELLNNMKEAIEVWLETAEEVPLHRELDAGLLPSQIKKAGLSVEEFRQLVSRSTSR